MEWKRVHFIGIGGYGMSAIAKVLLESGLQVTGSDVHCNARVEALVAGGARIAMGHAASHLDGAEVVIYSSSISPDNVEIQAAAERGIPVLHRSEMLARLLNTQQGIAVAGAHGKTTTSSMLAQTLVLCGVDPTYIVGGEVIGLGTNAGAGKSAYVVAEADESDGTFLAYHPTMAVVTNIEADHLENYGGDFTRLTDAYRCFLRQISPHGVAVLCWDDPHLRTMAEEVSGKLITYAVNHPADYRVLDPEPYQGGIRFSVAKGEEILGRLTLTKPGIHNAANALAAAIIALELGIPFATLAPALSAFGGAKRRFQILGRSDTVVVVDDYAHHPTEIISTIQAAKTWQKHLTVLFQPQRYSRTAFFMEEFAAAFAGADEVMLIPLYAPSGEAPIAEATSERLVERIARTHPNVRFLPSHEEAAQALLAGLRPNSMILTMGAGDVGRVAHRLVELLQERGLLE